MTDMNYNPVPHNHTAFLAAARLRPGLNEAYDSLALEYTVARQMLKARAKAGLTQEAVAEHMGTTKSAISPSFCAPKRRRHFFADSRRALRQP